MLDEPKRQPTAINVFFVKRKEEGILEGHFPVAIKQALSS